MRIKKNSEIFWRWRKSKNKEIEKYVTVHTEYKGCALGQRSRTDVVEELRDTAPYVAVIGDAAKVSTITNAVYWGYHAALDI